ncbi:nuclear transport factor 2 family protein [Paraburkholderia sp. BL25I1N1]|uniref:nuclear transport factor 2 family protein n=1 Tax=Paraburkholderia sp. BL25I1N1 TaxID=1938804 RepID=UPI000D07DE72|nr:nuclear transport factor 2 family protein [Paraburkholderia sp. BL25I1N1]PRX92067.1 SnoaL-like protein [Paraburkholderia sp. BL25I1N1]
MTIEDKSEPVMLDMIDALNAYAWALDTQQEEPLSRLFAQNVIARVSIEGQPEPIHAWAGRERVVAGLLDMRRAMPRWKGQHLTTPLFSAVASSRATVRSYVSLFRADAGQTPVLAATGKYKVEFSNAGSGWAVDQIELVWNGEPVD